MKYNEKFKGCFTALITPFKQGKVDEDAFASFVEWQIAQGIHGLVPCGTTGESPTLSHEEHNRVIELCVEVAKGRVPVMAGTGSNATSEAIMMTKHAEEVGADAALIVTPYYNKPTQEGLYQHFKAIHDATNIPIIMYNIPGRSVIDMTDATIASLAELPRIAGIKDATGNLSRPESLGKALGKRAENFAQISGEDGTALEFNEAGGVGCISVSSNIAPKECAEVQRLWLKGEKEKAWEVQKQLMPLHGVMFCETSPGPVKYAASLLGLCNGELRLPLVLPAEENKKKIKATLTALGML